VLFFLSLSSSFFCFYPLPPFSSFFRELSFTKMSPRILFLAADLTIWFGPGTLDLPSLSPPPPPVLSTMPPQFSVSNPGPRFSAVLSFCPTEWLENNQGLNPPLSGLYPIPCFFPLLYVPLVTLPPYILL